MGDEMKQPPLTDSLAGEVRGGSDDAAALPVRLSRYAQAHHRALDMAKYIKQSVLVKESSVSRVHGHLPQELKACGSYLLFRDYFRVGKVRLSAMRSCRKHLLCPLCAARRGAKMLQAYLRRLAVVQADRGESPLSAYLVTFTVKNGDDLLERFNHLKDSIKEYQTRRRNASKGLRSLVEMNKAVGGVGSYEFKRGKNSGQWHPHYHAVWLCDTPPDQDQISREWFEITGDSHVVNVTPFYDQNDVVSGFLEVFKYALKFSDMPLEQNWEGYLALSGRRLVNSFGVLWGVKVPDEMTDELLDDEPYVELFFKFKKYVGYEFKRSSGVIEPVERLFDGAPRSNVANMHAHLSRKYPTVDDLFLAREKI